MRKAALHNLGCKVNAYETEAMRQLLADGGYEIVPFTEKADVYVINTCSVTNMADRKSRQMIHRARSHNPDAVIVAAGCYVQAAFDKCRTADKGTNGEKTAADYSRLKEELGADLIIGNDRKHELLTLLECVMEEKSHPACKDADKGVMPYEQTGIHVKDIGNRSEKYEELPVAQPAEHTRAFVKIQDGCNQFCSYCIIPYVRGRVRSRSAESVLEEVRRLAENGYQEIVLTGIHLSSYGISEYRDGQGAGAFHPLLMLIRELSRIEGVLRIRLGSLEPGIVTEDFVKALSEIPEVCPHFHLSLQSGCDETLRRMNRRYTTQEYANSCKLLRTYFSDPAITTDVIVGFQLETEEEFAQTKRFLEEIHFYELHVFKYSRRQGTRAAQMPGQIPEQVKTQRSAELLALGEQMSDAYRRNRRGKPCSVLFEEETVINGMHYYTGFTPEYIRVAVPSELPLENHMIEGYVGKQLQGEIYQFLRKE